MRRGAGFVLFVSALRAAACTEDRPACHAGEYSACTCASGLAGYALCPSQAAGYGPCVCDGTTPGLDASVSTFSDASTDAPRNGDTRALFEECATNAQCDSGLCFTYGHGEMLCSKSCTVDADCPPPSTGCNGKKVCKGP